MSRVGQITFAGVFVALLIGCQFALTSFVGVEIITPLLLSYCFYFGTVQGMVVATGFSCLRCFIFGFSPTVFIVYMVYYNLFSVLFGLIGRARRTQLNVMTYVILTVTAVVSTAVFTLLDDVITPVFYGYTLMEAQVYFLASLAAMIPQCAFSALTVPLLTPPLLRAYKHLPRMNS